GLKLLRNKGAEGCYEIDSPVLQLRILLFEPAYDRFHLGLRLPDAYSGLHTRHRGDGVVQADFVGTIDGQRGPDIAVGKDRQRARRDSDDGGVDAAEGKVAADERFVPAEPSSPESFADHHHGRRGRSIFALPE